MEFIENAFVEIIIKSINSNSQSKFVEVQLSPRISGESLSCAVSHISDSITNGQIPAAINFKSPTVPSGITKVFERTHM